jgi:hypothetical protein
MVLYVTKFCSFAVLMGDNGQKVAPIRVVEVLPEHDEGQWEVKASFHADKFDDAVQEAERLEQEMLSEG